MTYLRLGTRIGLENIPAILACRQPHTQNAAFRVAPARPARHKRLGQHQNHGRCSLFPPNRHRIRAQPPSRFKVARRMNLDQLGVQPGPKGSPGNGGMDDERPGRLGSARLLRIDQHASRRLWAVLTTPAETRLVCAEENFIEHAELGVTLLIFRPF